MRRFAMNQVDSQKRYSVDDSHFEEYAEYMRRDSGAKSRRTIVSSVNCTTKRNVKSRND
jgi:hypothetical protein